MDVARWGGEEGTWTALVLPVAALCVRLFHSNSWFFFFFFFSLSWVLGPSLMWNSEGGKFVVQPPVWGNAAWLAYPLLCPSEYKRLSNLLLWLPGSVGLRGFKAFFLQGHLEANITSGHAAQTWVYIWTEPRLHRSLALLAKSVVGFLSAWPTLGSSLIVLEWRRGIKSYSAFVMSHCFSIRIILLLYKHLPVPSVKKNGNKTTTHRKQTPLLPVVTFPSLSKLKPAMISPVSTLPASNIAWSQRSLLLTQLGLGFCSQSFTEWMKLELHNLALTSPLLNWMDVFQYSFAWHHSSLAFFTHDYFLNLEKAFVWNVWGCFPALIFILLRLLLKMSHLIIEAEICEGSVLLILWVTPPTPHPCLCTLWPSEPCPYFGDHLLLNIPHWTTLRLLYLVSVILTLLGDMHLDILRAQSKHDQSLLSSSQINLNVCFGLVVCDSFSVYQSLDCPGLAL